MQPFSVGPRSCISRNLVFNEMRLIRARLLWDFDLALGPESDDQMDQKTYVTGKKRPMFVKLKQRVEAVAYLGREANGSWSKARDKFLY